MYDEMKTKTPRRDDPSTPTWEAIASAAGHDPLAYTDLNLGSTDEYARRQVAGVLAGSIDYDALHVVKGMSRGSSPEEWKRQARKHHPTITTVLDRLWDLTPEDLGAERAEMGVPYDSASLVLTVAAIAGAGLAPDSTENGLYIFDLETVNYAHTGAVRAVRKQTWPTAEVLVVSRLCWPELRPPSRHAGEPLTGRIEPWSDEWVDAHPNSFTTLAEVNGDRLTIDQFGDEL